MARQALKLPIWFSAFAYTMAAIAFVITWMVLDNEPPYEREGGVMVAASPEQCHIDSADSDRGISPGSCVSPQWKVKALRQCRPAPGFPVERWITTSNGNRIHVGTAKSEYDQKSPVGGTTELKRTFVLPLGIPEGPSEYEATACFVCNPLQELLSPMLDVCVGRDKNDRIKFNVERPKSYFERIVPR